MLISCPKCNSVYNISDTRVPENGKKFKCAECGTVWKVLPQDVQKLEPENKNTPNLTAEERKNENDDINAMFSRLSHNTKNLFAGENNIENMSTADRFYHFCRNFFSVYVIVAFLLVSVVVLTMYLAYQKRYDIVASVPSMEKVYGRLNIESVYKGKGLIFRDVSIKELGYNPKNAVEISGRLYNSSNIAVRAIPVKASIINKNGEVESEVTELLPMQLIAPKNSVLFRIVVDNPSINANKIKLDLEDITQN